MVSRSGTAGDVQTLVATEYRRLADLLEGLADTDWDTFSLCHGWRVREVVAHMTMPVRYDEQAFVSELRAWDFDFGRLSNEIAWRDVKRLLGSYCESSGPMCSTTGCRLGAGTSGHSTTLSSTAWTSRSRWAGNDWRQTRPRGLFSMT